MQVSKHATRSYREQLEIKTYLKEKPDPNPRYFEFEGLAHQGVQRHAYPYPMDDNLTDTPFLARYEARCLENEYVKIAVVPELGGRIYSAIDKTNDYEFIYRNVVVKPSLIGMVGSWISGGIAWGFPHHHGPLTMAPFEHREVEHADGSSTVWMAKTDLRHRMRMLIGITVHPDRSYVEAEVVLDNRTPLVNSFLFWANPSVKADPTYQVFFGPSVEYACQHHKPEFVRWPIGDGFYVGADYADVDVSYWRNVKKPSSFFCWDSHDDFIAGYSHGAKAGTAYVGNHHILPGMKVWEHGDNPEGNVWRHMLTDNDDHYIELMAGAFTDNQPDYSWIQPYELKHFKQYWFPIRDLDGVSFVNLNGALNLRLDGGVAKVGVNTTSRQESARVTLRAKGLAVFERSATISPDRPFAADVRLDAAISETDLDLSVVSSSGDELLRYQPRPRAGKARPKPVEQPRRPEEYESVEELYLVGLRLDQFYNAVLEPNPYFEEALRRDSGNYDLNVWLGIKACRAKAWASAERHLRTAIARVTHNYTRPKDGEAFYYLGVALRAQGKLDEAYDQFYKAVWSAAWHSAGYFALAGLDCRRGEFATALGHVDRALSTDAASVKMLTLRAIVLRKLGRMEEARRLAEEIGRRDVLDFQSRNEVYLLCRESGKHEDAELKRAELDELMRDDLEVYLELSAEYASSGLYEEAIDVLARCERKLGPGEGESAPIDPMLYYHLGHYWFLRGDGENSARYFGLGARQPVECCFPYREESLAALESARSVDPKDSAAPYLIGNLLYPHQPGRAIAAWEEARALDPGYARVHRNLAWGYRWHEKDLPKAIASLGEAIKLDSSDPRFLYELDVCLERANAPFERRLDVLTRHRSTAEKRDDAMTRVALILVQTGDYDEAIRILTTRHFHGWEGVFFLHNLYESACQLRGLRRLKDGDAKGALADFLAAYEYPLNLDLGRPIHDPRFAQTLYLIGLGYESTGDAAAAREHYLKAVAENADDSEYQYYQGLAFGKLGQPKGAEQMLTKLEKLSTHLPARSAFQSFRALLPTPEEERARQHYIRGLAYAGKGLVVEARKEFAEAVALNPNDVWYRHFLQEVGADLSM